jgi:hypothetical protein
MAHKTESLNTQVKTKNMVYSVKYYRESGIKFLGN